MRARQPSPWALTPAFNKRRRSQASQSEVHHGDVRRPVPAAYWWATWSVPLAPSVAAKAERHGAAKVIAYCTCRGAVGRAIEEHQRIRAGRQHHPLLHAAAADLAASLDIARSLRKPCFRINSEDQISAMFPLGPSLDERA